MSTVPTNINNYLRQFAHQLEERILEQFPPLHQPGEPFPAELARLRRTPYHAQALAITGISKRWEVENSAGAIAECGTGKTFISLGAMFVNSKGRPFTALVMAPPQLTIKWCREPLLTLPRVRVFLIDGVRNGVGSNGHTGVNEVRLRNGRIVREGLQTTLSDLRLQKQFKSARARWQSLCDCPAVFVLSREVAKLSYFWQHAYGVPRSGPFNGSIVNPDTGRPVLTDDDQLRRADFRKTKHSELVLSLIVDRPDAVPAEYWRVSVTLGVAELQELLSRLPEDHPLRARSAVEINGSVKREPDNLKLRSALASGIPIQGAELRRGQHVRLT